MPARVILVHDDPEVLEPATAALRVAGHDVAAFADSMAAISALEDARVAELLITRVRFPLGTPNGVSLARMARIKRPGIKVLFAALPEMEEHAGDLGEFMPMPVDMSELVATVTRVLAECDQSATSPERPRPT
jgi:DNA-binding response OmpR family regulator